MDFTSAIKTVLSNYANFNDRSGRPEFWWWVLAYFIVSFLIQLIAPADGGFPGLNLPFIFSLAVLVPNFALAVRRMHDIGKSGWWVLIGFIPLIGWLVILYFYVQPSQGPNQYGEGPLAPVK